VCVYVCVCYECEYGCVGIGGWRIHICMYVVLCTRVYSMVRGECMCQCVCSCVCVVFVCVCRYLLELDCEGDPAWECISNMCLWILRLLYTSKEDHQDTQGNRLQGELASLPSELAPQVELAPSLPPRSKSVAGREGHSRSISDVSFVSTSSYGSQTTYSGMTSATNSELWEEPRARVFIRCYSLPSSFVHSRASAIA